jgi:hypothetical protein
LAIVGVCGDDTRDFGAVIVVIERRRIVIDQVVHIANASLKIEMRYVDTCIDDRDMDLVALTEVVREGGIGFHETALKIDVGIVVLVRVPGFSPHRRQSRATVARVALYRPWRAL